RTIRVEPPTQALRSVLDRLPNAKAVEGNGSLYYQVPSDTAYPQLLRDLVAADAVTRFDALEPSLQDIYMHTIANTIAAPTGGV
ncbi:MAG TPA: DUF4162 domain-containing protein, partial [Candidatus Baltobacteraceae bacterium]